MNERIDDGAVGIVDDELSRMTPREFAASMRAARARCDAAPRRKVERTAKEKLETLRRHRAFFEALAQSRSDQ